MEDKTVTTQPVEHLSPPGSRYGLTSIEIRELELLAKGMEREEIAELLDVSVNAVNFHLENAYRKFAEHNFDAAAAK